MPAVDRINKNVGRRHRQKEARECEMKPMKPVVYSPKNKAEYIYLAEAHVDPKHKDIVFNGYGISVKQAKEMRDWLTKAIREVKK